MVDQVKDEWVRRVLGFTVVRSATGGESQSTETQRVEARADDPTARLYQQRLAALTPSFDHALKEQIGDVGKIRAVAAFAREKAGLGVYDAALKALDALEALLRAPLPVPDGADSFSAESFDKLHEAWISGKQQVHRALAELHAEIIDEFDDPESTSAADKLARILARFDAGLSETLETLRDVADAGTRGRLAAKAVRIADMYLAYLNVDPLVAHVEANPYEVDVPINGTLAPTLTAIREEASKFSAA